MIVTPTTNTSDDDHDYADEPLSREARALIGDLAATLHAHSPLPVSAHIIVEIEGQVLALTNQV